MGHSLDPTLELVEDSTNKNEEGNFPNAKNKMCFSFLTDVTSGGSEIQKIQHTPNHELEHVYYEPFIIVYHWALNYFQTSFKLVSN